jgi:hypothetical protein
MSGSAGEAKEVAEPRDGEGRAASAWHGLSHPGSPLVLHNNAALAHPTLPRWSQRTHLSGRLPTLIKKLPAARAASVAPIPRTPRRLPSDVEDNLRTTCTVTTFASHPVACASSCDRVARSINLTGRLRHVAKDAKTCLWTQCRRTRIHHFIAIPAYIIRPSEGVFHTCTRLGSVEGIVRMP